MTRAFGPTYADAYDALYAEKDYEAECDLIEQLAERHGRGSATILDLGCGTGRHAVILAGRGRDVTGVDLSEEMLEVAHQRAISSGTDGLDLRLGDVRNVRLNRRFDVVLLMFAVLGYQVTDPDVTSTLDTAARHLKPGGALLFDVWHGPGVLALGPSVRTKSVVRGDEVIRRHASGTLDADSNSCVVDYTVERLVNGKAVASDHEQHRMRYFFPDELTERVAEAGLEIVTASAFPATERPASTADWNALYVARGIPTSSSD